MGGWFLLIDRFGLTNQSNQPTHQGANTGSGSSKTKAGRGAGGAPWLPVIVEVDG
jgi:hypothetical protein